MTEGDNLYNNGVFRESKRFMNRNQLGEKWIEALVEFEGLVHDLKKIPRRKKYQIGHAYVTSLNLGHKSNENGIKKFFRKPSLENIEEMLSIMPSFKDEADNLNGVVDAIRVFMEPKK